MYQSKHCKLQLTACMHAVSGVISTKNIVGQGYLVTLNVTIHNQGSFLENFTLSLYCNSTLTTSQLAYLHAGTFSTITLVWNTTGFPYGNYTMTANATILQGETDTADNTFVDGTIIVTIFGDFDGDGEVDIGDVRRVARAYLSAAVDDPETPWDEIENWDPVVDVAPEGGNGKITIADVRAVARHYLETV